MYRHEERVRTILSIFAALAAFVACLGALALAAFECGQRTKEIGIRKSIGATTTQMVWLLTREFVGLLALASALAWPVIYLAMRDWLEGFAYHHRPDIAVFAEGSALLMIVVSCVVAWQGLHAARANPAQLVRYE